MRVFALSLSLLVAACAGPAMTRVEPATPDTPVLHKPNTEDIAVAYWATRVPDPAAMALYLRRPLPQGDNRWAICGTLVRGNQSPSEPFLLLWRAGKIEEQTGDAARAACSAIAEAETKTTS